MIITKAQRARMDRACRLFTKADVEFDKVEEPIQIIYEVTTGSADIPIFGAVGAPFKFEVLDVVVQPRGASTNGTLKLADGSNDITDAMTCAADKTMVRPATIDDAYSTIAKGGNLQIVCAGDSVGSTIALVTVLVREVE